MDNKNTKLIAVQIFNANSFESLDKTKVVKELNDTFNNLVKDNYIDFTTKAENYLNFIASKYPHVPMTNDDKEGDALKNAAHSVLELINETKDKQLLNDYLKTIDFTKLVSDNIIKADQVKTSLHKSHLDEKIGLELNIKCFISEDTVSKITNK